MYYNTCYFNLYVGLTLLPEDWLYCMTHPLQILYFLSYFQHLFTQIAYIDVDILNSVLVFDKH